MTIAAFFDIDGTLARESMLIHHFKRLIRYDIIDEKEWFDRIRPLYQGYERRYAEYDVYLDEVAEIYRTRLLGVSAAVIDFTAQQVVDEYGDVVYKFTRDRIAWHQKQGHLVFFISGSPDFLIDKMAKKYGVTAYRATKYLRDEKDCFTAQLIPMWDSRSKSKVIDELVAEYDLDLSASYAYGDTNGDLSMLQRVGNPTALNPSYRLLELIRNEKELADRVNIVVERKDVAYHVRGDVYAESTLLAHEMDDKKE